MDHMTQLVTHPMVRQLVKSLSLPVTLPTLIRRKAETEWQRPLLGRRVYMSTFGKDAPHLVRALSALGANLTLAGDSAQLRGALDVAQAAGRHAHTIDAKEGDVAAVVAGLVAAPEKNDAFVFDVARLGGSRQLFALLQPLLASFPSHARLIFVTHLGDKATPREAAEAQGVFGFVKSLARELGRKAITVNVIEARGSVHRDAFAHAVAFFASDRARYVTSQRVVLSSSNRKVAPTLALTGEHALVTGGARGIGAAIAQVLARQGAHVTVIDLANARDGAAQTCAEISRAGGRAHFVPCDVTKDDEVNAALAAAKAAFGPITALINNAGITRDKTFAKMKEAQWNQVLDVNFEAAVRLTEKVIDEPGSHDRRIVLLSSVAGIAGNFGQTNYSLSKAALIGYARSLSEQRSDVQINVIAPGFIDTVLTREIPLLNREVAKQLISLLQAGEPEDIAEIAAFLSSPAAVGLSGETIRVDGGMFIGQ